MSIFFSDEKPLLKKSFSIFLAFLAFTIIYARNADAITITNNYVSTNSPTTFYAWDAFDREVREFDRSQPNWDSIGNMGDRIQSFDNAVVNIIEHASSIWESAIRDTYTIELTWSWESIANIGNFTPLGATTYSDNSIVFNNLNDSWYIDCDPQYSQEYVSYRETLNNLRYGGILGHGWDSRELSQTDDLFSIALHEIGHALGFDRSNAAFERETQPWFGYNDYDIDITSPFPQEGLEIPVETNSAHIDGFALLSELTDDGVRQILTDWDVLAVAQINNWTDVYLPTFNHVTIDDLYNTQGIYGSTEYTWESVYNVPEPSTLLLMSVGMIGLGAARLRKKIQSSF